jgi:uncharacterized protein YbaR (Trm112 family)
MLEFFLACPRCDKTPLKEANGVYHCDACKIDFPSIDGIPWMFADPEATLGEWRGRLQFSLQQLSHEALRLEAELKQEDLRPLAKRRIERYKKATESHRRSLQKLLQPVDVQSMQGNYESYLALRTRLPADQALNTYYANVHRDWAWGDEENNASLNQIRAVVQESAELGKVLVIGAGASRLAYDLHMQMDCTATIAMDFNPLLLLIAKAVTRGDTLKMYEFPIAPKSLEDDAVLRSLGAPEVVREEFHFVLGDALRPPTVVDRYRDRGFASTRCTDQRSAQERRPLDQLRLACFCTSRESAALQPGRNEGYRRRKWLQRSVRIRGNDSVHVFAGESSRPAGEGLHVLGVQGTRCGPASPTPRPAQLDSHGQGSGAADPVFPQPGDDNANLLIHHVVDRRQAFAKGHGRCARESKTYDTRGSRARHSLLPDEDVR